MKFDVAHVTRPAKGEVVSGDAAFILEDEAKLFCGVVDGLGHGPDAAEASAAFVAHVTEHCCQSLDQMMLGASKGIANTRGAAASIMRFDFEEMTFEYCGIGNCHLHVRASERINPVSLPGIVGHRIRKAVASATPLPEGKSLFVLCSDGIASHPHLDDFTGLTAEQVAYAVLERDGKSHDDATVLVVRVSDE